MDFFGIGSSVKGVITVFFEAARGTGRSTVLLGSLRDGDRVVFATAREAAHFQRSATDKGLEIQCVSIDPCHPERLLDRLRSPGRIVFDHRWLEMYYLDGIDRCQKEIQRLGGVVGGRIPSKPPLEPRNLMPGDFFNRALRK